MLRSFPTVSFQQNFTDLPLLYFKPLRNTFFHKRHTHLSNGNATQRNPERWLRNQYKINPNSVDGVV